MPIWSCEDVEMVATHVVGEDPLGLLVPAAAGNVDIRVVEQHPHLGPFRDGIARIGYLLDELGDGRNMRVGLLVQSSVDADRLRDARRAYDNPAVRVVGQYRTNQRRRLIGGRSPGGLRGRVDRED